MKKSMNQEPDAFARLARESAKNVVESLKFVATEVYNKAVLDQAIETLTKGCSGPVAEAHKKTLGTLAKIAADEGRTLEEVARDIAEFDRVYVVCYKGGSSFEQPEDEL